ncbi:MAG TPA: cyanophycin synthetase, partial [Bryobacteraceae bacterium]|nr:cyanophycin synthetase [Bryobacteraceae bacterium]
TNVVEPRLAVITPVDFDHEAFLGSSLDQIAGEKAGILKPGIDAVIAPQRPEASVVIENRAAELKLVPDFVMQNEPTNVRVHAHGSQFEFRGLSILCPLAGSHQVINAATAAAALKHLGISTAGIGQTVWPGRLETVTHYPEIILDGAHNPAGARALAAHIERFYSGRTIWLIYGAMRDKSVEEITEVLFPLATHVIATAPRFARALRPEALSEISSHPSIQVTEDLSHAIDAVRALALPTDVVFITGSLYLVGEARALLVK